MLREAVEIFGIVVCLVILFLSLCYLAGAMFFAGPTGNFHVGTPNTDGAAVAYVFEDRKFAPDPVIYRGTPQNAIRLWMMLVDTSTAAPESNYKTADLKW